MNVFEKIASEINEERKKEGKKISITPQIVEETIENTWDEARKNRLSSFTQKGNIDQEISINEELYSPVPTEQSLSQKIEDIDNQSKQALWQAKTALREAKEALKRSNHVETIVVALFIAIALAFIWWLYTSIISVQEATHTFYQKGIELERKISEYDEKIKIVEETQKELEQWIDNKISAEINKRIIEFFMKDKQIKITE